VHARSSAAPPFGDTTKRTPTMRCTAVAVMQECVAHRVRVPQGPPDQRQPPPRRLGVLQSKRLLIETRWVSTPLAFAGKLRPRRFNNWPF
jgi:hypothetical protein